MREEVGASFYPLTLLVNLDFRMIELGSGPSASVVDMQTKEYALHCLPGTNLLLGM